MPPPLLALFQKFIRLGSATYPLIKVVDDFKGSPHLVLMAARVINIGEEITFDYGVSNIVSWSAIVAVGWQYC